MADNNQGTPADAGVIMLKSAGTAAPYAPVGGCVRKLTGTATFKDFSPDALGEHTTVIGVLTGDQEHNDTKKKVRQLLRSEDAKRAFESVELGDAPWAMVGAFSRRTQETANPNVEDYENHAYAVAMRSAAPHEAQASVVRAMEPHVDKGESWGEMFALGTDVSVANAAMEEASRKNQLDTLARALDALGLDYAKELVVAGEYSIEPSAVASGYSLRRLRANASNAVLLYAHATAQDDILSRGHTITTAGSGVNTSLHVTRYHQRDVTTKQRAALPAAIPSSLSMDWRAAVDARAASGRQAADAAQLVVPATAALATHGYVSADVEGQLNEETRKFGDVTTEVWHALNVRANEMPKVWQAE